MKTRFLLISILLVLVVAAVLIKPYLFQPKELVVKISNPKEGESIGIITLNNKRVTLDKLLKRLDEAPDEIKDILTIHSDREVLHEQLVEIMEIAAQAGIEKIHFGPSSEL